MIDSRGGVTGGASIRDFMSDFARQGYTSHFAVLPGGRLECAHCRERIPARDVIVRSMRRVEGASDPADMSIVGALDCPRCGARGTATFGLGTHGSPEDGEVLRALDDRRHSRLETLRAGGDDNSLVADSGWLPGPREG